MKSYDTRSAVLQKRSTKWLFLCSMIIFCMTLTSFTLLEIRNLYTDEPSVVRIIMNSFKSNEEKQLPETSKNKFILVNVEQQQNTEELLSAIIAQEELKATETERQIRETPSVTNNSYYEEQSPVVVYSRSGQEAPLSYRQSANMPPKQDFYDEETFNEPAEDRQDPYYASEEQGDYGDQQQQEQPNYDPSPAYDDSREGYADSSENFSEQNSAEQQEFEEGRASQQDSYYRQWHYATPAPAPPTYTAGSNKKFSSMNDQEKRKLQTMTSQNQHNRDPFPVYSDDYDYMPPHSQPSSQQQLQAYHSASSASSQAVQNPEKPQQEMSFLTILKTLKAMWDLYQSFIATWNTMAERHNKAEELAKEKYKEQMQLRLQTNKQQKLNNKKSTTTRTTKNPKKPVTTTTARTIKTTAIGSLKSTTEINNSSEDLLADVKQKDAKAKVEPRKGLKGDKRNSKDVESLREKRQTSETNTVMTDSVGEGRYIKGDPLKGYYDFVITEGSYKFWAAFQLGTAVLIIYSTFAAIYYSKVNPLVSDYDYTDYLGGARSMTGGDLDFVDDDTTSAIVQQKSWFDFLPRSGHSLKFILDAIDKLPTDLLNEGIDEQTTKRK